MPEITTPAKKIRPDGMAIAIRTHFSDEPMGPFDPTRAWLAVSHMGQSSFLTEEQVTDWTDVP